MEFAEDNTSEVVWNDWVRCHPGQDYSNIQVFPSSTRFSGVDVEPDEMAGVEEVEWGFSVFSQSYALLYYVHTVHYFCLFGFHTRFVIVLPLHLNLVQPWLFESDSLKQWFAAIFVSLYLEKAVGWSTVDAERSIGYSSSRSLKEGVIVWSHSKLKSVQDILFCSIVIYKIWHTCWKNFFGPFLSWRSG